MGIDWQPNMYNMAAGFSPQLEQWAKGQGGPSAAEQQLAGGLASATRRGQALAQQPGTNPALMAAMAMRGASGMSMDTNRQAAGLRAQEQQSAIDRYLALEQQKAQQAYQYDQMAYQKALQEAMMSQQWKTMLMDAGFSAASGAGGKLFDMFKGGL